MIQRLDLSHLLPEERAHFKRAARLGGAAWFRRFAVAIEGADGRTRLDLTRTPYLREILDACTSAEIREILMICGTQLGKTTLLRIATAMLSEQARGDLLFCMPTDEEAKEYNETHFTPTVLAIDHLRRMLPPEGTKAFQRRVKLALVKLPHCNIFFTGLQKPKKAKRRPIWVVVADEIDEIPTVLGEQGDPLELVNERQRTYEDRGAKTLLATTPTTDRGHAVTRWRTKQDHRRYYVPCPHCGAFGVMVNRESDWHGDAPLHVLKFERHVTPRMLEAEGGDELAWLECCDCKGRIHSHHKPAMLAAGRWVSAIVSDETESREAGETIDRDGVIHTVDPNGERRRIPIDEDPTPATSVYRTRYAGYWINAFYSPWLSFSKIAAKFLQAKRQGAEALRNFINSWLAEPYQETLRQIPLHMVRGRIDRGLPLGVVPSWAKILTLGVDTQTHKDVFKWVKLAAGAGRRPHVVDYGVIRIGDIPHGETVSSGFLDLLDVVDREHPTLGDRSLLCELACIDSGGGREIDIYEWCDRRHGVTIPIKGQDIGKPVQWSTVEYVPNSGRADESMCRLMLINTQSMKDSLFEHLRAGSESPIRFSFCAQAANDEEFLLEFTREEKRDVLVGRRGVPHAKDARSMWQKFGSGANDYFDATVYAYAGLYVLKHLLEDEREAMVADDPEPGQTEKASRDSPPIALPRIRLPRI